MGLPDDAADSDRERGSESLSERRDIPEPSTPEDLRSGEVFCNGCGAPNPPDANFCSRCGERLRRTGDDTARATDNPPSLGNRSTAPRPSNTASESVSSSSQGALTRHVAVLIGLAVLVVVALFMITVMSKQQAPRNSEAAVDAPAETRSAAVIQEHEAIPIAEVYRERSDSLRAVIESGGEAEGVRARRELVDFLIGIGRIDRAAIEQQRVARITNQTTDWRKAGNLLFDWMETTELESKPDVALLAIDAYKRVLEQQPDDLDARADLGWAYQYDPQNPMEAIRQTNLVLEERPDHLTANYNRGVFLMRINRLDDAVEQFERVKAIAGAESPYFRQAELWIETIRDSQREAG